LAQPTTSPWRQQQDPWLAAFPPRRWHFALIAGALTVTYLAGVTALWWPTPDSALYQSLAKSLLAGEGYRFNGHPSTNVTPGLPLLVAGIKAVCGPWADWATNLAMALCGLAMLLGTYLAVAQIAGRRMGLAVALTTGVTYKTYELSHLVLTDIPFAAVFWWLLYACLRYAATGRRRWLTVIAALVAVGITLRAPGLVQLVALLPAMVLDRGRSSPARRRWAVAGVVAGTAAALALAYVLAATHAVAKLPAYAACLRQGLGTVARLRDRLATVAMLPLLTPGPLSELVLSQKLVAAGVVLAVLGLVGMGSLWSRGRRLTAVIVILSLVELALAAGSDAIRERYLLAIYPLIVLSILEGLCAAVAGAGALARWSRRAGLGVALTGGLVALAAAAGGGVALLRGRVEMWWFSLCAVAATAAVLARVGLASLPRPSGKVYLQAVSVLVTLIALTNLPRLGRNAFYYGYLGRGDAKTYYATIRGGQFAELFDVAELLRTAGSPHDRIATVENMVSILHYLTGRIAAGVNEIPRNTAARADAVYEQYLATGAPLLATQTPEGEAAYRQRLEARFAATGEFVVLHTDKQFLVYQKVSPGPAASQPASGPLHP
jgi:4-amino-4-deoxy-L-arabinose transferase-like glycosyltransferase